MSSRLSDYDYDLPRELIASRPLPRREDARMMVIDRASQTIAHHRFVEFSNFLSAGDLVVLNDTRVLAARRFSDDGAFEFLFLDRLGPNRWKCLVKPGRKLRVGSVTKINQVNARVEEIVEDGARIIATEEEIDLYAGGSMPLPPYLGRESDQEDDSRYQTVFASRPGAIAAPTAGLHFTPEILARVPHVFVTLHVGPGTFRPVHAENITEHRMHAEQFEISAETADAIKQAERVVAVGTTSVRVLESAARKDMGFSSQGGATDIFIYPPFEFRVVDALLTNFHLPRSTLLILVSALAGRELILRAYAEAVREKYRFFSYGDCMLIL